MDSERGIDEVKNGLVEPFDKSNFITAMMIIEPALFHN